MIHVPLHCLVILLGGDRQARSDVCAFFEDHEILTREKIAVDIFGSRHVDSSVDLISEIHRRAHYKLVSGRRAVIDISYPEVNLRQNMAAHALAMGIKVFYIVCGKTDLSMARCEKDVKIISAGRDRFEVVSYRKPGLDVLRARYSGITVIPDLHGDLTACRSAIRWARSRHHYMIFLGDMIDYGADSLKVADDVYKVCMGGEGELLLGNHERKIYRFLNQNGRTQPRLSEGNRVTIAALSALPSSDQERWRMRFRASVVSANHFRRLGSYVFAHAAIPPQMWIGQTDFRDIERYCLFGEFDQKTNSRTYNWIDHVPNGYKVVVGHDNRAQGRPLEVVNDLGGKALFMDIGCGKDGHLASADLKFKDGDLHLANFNIH